jgi:hypothetical protein
MASKAAWANGLDRLRGLGDAGMKGQAFSGEFRVYLNHEMKHDTFSTRGTGSARALVHADDGIVQIISSAVIADIDDNTPNPDGKGYLDESAERMLNPRAVRRLVFPGVFLSSCMSSAELKTEQDELLDGQAASHATFALDSRWQPEPNGQRGGEHTLHIWTGSQDSLVQTVEVERWWRAQAGPHHSRTTTIRYAMSGQRLIATRLEERTRYTSTGLERRELDVLTLVPSA